MTREETVNVLFKLQCAYPLFYSNRTQNDFSSVAMVWHEHIGYYETGLVGRAVDWLIDNETEVPTIALLKRYIQKAQEQMKNEQELSSQNLERVRRLAR